LEFLARIQIAWPTDGDEALRRELIHQEAARAAELCSQGHILRLWRTVGGWGNIGLWSAKDATELHDLISSLPLHRWMDVHIDPLAMHPSDPGPAGGG
jgi:muconolactone D-isomerase